MSDKPTFHYEVINAPEEGGWGLVENNNGVAEMIAVIYDMEDAYYICSILNVTSGKSDER